MHPVLINEPKIHLGITNKNIPRERRLSVYTVLCSVTSWGSIFQSNHLWWEPGALCLTIFWLHYTPTRTSGFLHAMNIHKVILPNTIALGIRLNNLYTVDKTVFLSCALISSNITNVLIDNHSVFWGNSILNSINTLSTTFPFPPQGLGHATATAFLLMVRCFYKTWQGAR